VTDSLPCPRCGGPSDLATWLDRAQPKHAADGAICSACPRCEAESFLALRNAEAAIGTLSPAPAMFRPERRVRIEGLAVDARFDHTRVTLGKRSWRFETAR
jgi:ribosomal protein S27AE